MEFRHAFVGYFFEAGSQITMLAVDDEIDCSLGIFEEQSKPANIDQMACENLRRACANSYPNSFATRAVSLLGECIDRREFMRIAAQIDKVALTCSPEM
jgi:hypothetical protein